jgi:hypothetical protein
VLTTLDFTSERARMSVIARAPDGTLRLFCKGSDQAMLARLRPGTAPALLDATHAHLRRFSVQARTPARRQGAAAPADRPRRRARGGAAAAWALIRVSLLTAECPQCVGCRRA